MMTRNLAKLASGRAGTVAILCGIGLLAWLILRGTDTEARARSRLIERGRAYARLRVDGDWVRLYSMVDPEQRRRVDLATFLKTHGTGMLKIHHARLVGIKIHPELPVAMTKIETEGELVLAKVPAQFRKGLQIENPRDLVSKADAEIEWVWRDGDWYFKMDRSILSGRDERGQPISFVGGSSVPTMPQER